MNEANTSKVKYAKDEEPLVTDNFNIKAPGYFKLFKYGKSFFNNLDAMYYRDFMAGAKGKYWVKMYDTI